ncbi:hypothetical protein EV379_3123 [Microterricola gilva]|uniref:Uncharacterized protein n=1 Tax=Microterricola gilva TaxID=393267 RepID=A0A4Q8AQ35_9MICO|nr:hypothetical protein [Microterricola gilva]RZU66757.1 hypothetical protein EV379_3123 [Microterricola gilva]
MTANAEQRPIEATVDAQIDADLRQKAEESGELTFLGSIEAFIAVSRWLGPEHGPALVTLRALARQLDQRVTAAMVAQFGVAFRDLRSQAPSAPPASDGVEDIIDEARSS